MRPTESHKGHKPANPCGVGRVPSCLHNQQVLKMFLGVITSGSGGAHHPLTVKPSRDKPVQLRTGKMSFQIEQTSPEDVSPFS